MKFHIIHDWSKWGDPFDSILSNSAKAQARRCNCCGVIQVRKIKSPWNWWFNAKQTIESLKGTQ